MGLNPVQKATYLKKSKVGKNEECTVTVKTATDQRSQALCNISTHQCSQPQKMDRNAKLRTTSGDNEYPPAEQPTQPSKVIPSCAVNLIRKTFPEDDGQYSGFQEGDIKDAEYEASWNLELQV